MKHKTKSSVKLNMLLNAFRMGLTVLMPLITFPYSSRIFLTEGTGLLNFAGSAVSIFTLFASLGIYTYGVREGVKVRGDRNAFSHLAQELLIINAAATGITYTVFFIALYSIPSFSSRKEILCIYSIMIVFTALGCDWIYGVYEEYLYITVRQIIVQIFTIAAMFLLVREESDLYIWAGILVFSSVGANIFNMFHARRYLSLHKIGPYHFRRHLAPVFILFATQLASKVYNNLDTLLLGTISTDHQTGIYAAAVKMNTVMVTVFAAMSPVFVPRIVTLLAEKRYVDYEKFIRRIFQFVFMLGIPSVVGLVMMREQIIVLLAGEAFMESAGTMLILVPVILVTSCANILYYNIIVPTGRENGILICTAAAAFINLVSSAVLIPRFQANGAAAGSLIAETAGLVMAVIFARRTGRFNRRCIPSCAAYLAGGTGIIICCSICNYFLRGHPTLNLTAAIAGSVVLYGVILILFRDPLIFECFHQVRKVMTEIKNKL